VSIEYYGFVSIHLSQLSGMQIASFLRCIVPSSTGSLAEPYFYTLSHARHDFQKKK